PPVTCAHGALLQHAASAGIVSHLRRPTMGRAAPKLEVAPCLRRFERRTSLYALPVRTGYRGRSVRGVSAQKTGHIGRGPGNIACRSICTLAADPQLVAGLLDRRPSIV